MLQKEAIGLVPGTGRYTVVASIAGDPSLTIRGEFTQDPHGSVLTARTAAEHMNAICSYRAVLSAMILTDAVGLELYEDPEPVAAAAFIGVELQQLLMLTGRVGLEIDAEIYRDVCATLCLLRGQLTHLREIHQRGHARDVPYLPEYFAFVAENPIPDDDGSS